MAKIFGILLIVLALWVGAEIQTHGTHGAFDGKLAPYLGESKAPAEQRASTPQRAGAAVRRAHQEKEQRYEKLLDN